MRDSKYTLEEQAAYRLREALDGRWLPGKAHEHVARWRVEMRGRFGL